MSTVGSLPFTIRFWGVRGSIPCPEPDNLTYGGNTSCVQVILPHSSEYLILDSGSGIRALGNQLVDTGIQKKGRIFVTHAHWDHIQGFPFFKPIYDPDNEVQIYFPKQDDATCHSAMTTQLTPTHFPVTADMLSAKIDFLDLEAGIHDFGTFKVEYMFARHPVPTAMYKFHIDDTTLIYAPDNEIKLIDDDSFFNSMKGFITGADVLIHDGNYDKAMYHDRIDWGHSAWEDIVDLASDAGVRHLFLTHHDQSSTDSVLRMWEGRLQGLPTRFESVQFAREGLVYKF